MANGYYNQNQQGGNGGYYNQNQQNSGNNGGRNWNLVKNFQLRVNTVYPSKNGGLVLNCSFSGEKRRDGNGWAEGIFVSVFLNDRTNAPRNINFEKLNILVDGFFAIGEYTNQQGVTSKQFKIFADRVAVSDYQNSNNNNGGYQNNNGNGGYYQNQQNGNNGYYGQNGNGGNNGGYQNAPQNNQQNGGYQQNAPQNGNNGGYRNNNGNGGNNGGYYQNQQNGNNGNNGYYGQNGNGGNNGGYQNAPQNNQQSNANMGGFNDEFLAFNDSDGVPF